MFSYGINQKKTKQFQTVKNKSKLSELRIETKKKKIQNKTNFDFDVNRTFSVFFNYKKMTSTHCSDPK